LKERRKLGKRILKSVEALLEAAVRAEADISGKPASAQVKEFQQLIEASLQVGPDSISVSLGE